MTGWKQLAGVLASIGVLVAVWIALAPISVDAPHADGRCGPPLVRLAARAHVDDPNEQAIIDRCEEAAAGRLALAGLAVVAGGAGFVAARMIGRRRAHVLRTRRWEARVAREGPESD